MTHDFLILSVGLGDARTTVGCSHRGRAACCELETVSPCRCDFPPVVSISLRGKFWGVTG